MLSRVLLPLFILTVGVAGFAALVRSKPQPTPIRAEERAWAVAVESLSPGSLTPHLTLYGRVESPRTTRLSAAVAADVVDVRVLEGDPVSADAVLAMLDDAEARLAVRQIDAEIADIEAQIAGQRERHANDRNALVHERRLLELANHEVDRARELASSNVGSRAQLDAARQSAERAALAVTGREFALRQHGTLIAQLEARAEQARARRERAVLDVERTRIRPPFPGRVSRVDVSVGDRVRVGDPLLEIFDTGALEIRAQVPTRNLSAIRSALARGESLAARASVDGEAIAARLDRLAAEVARGAGGTDALFTVISGGERLALGRTVELLLSLPAVTDACAVPVEALYGSDRVYLLDGDRLKGVKVERLGERREPNGLARVLVRGPGLAAGRKVVVTNLPNAFDGLRVRVVDGP